MSKIKIPKNKAYGFWSYDLPPFIHGGKVIDYHRDPEMRDYYAHIKDYAGACFRISFFLDAKKGRKLLKKLDDLNKGQRAEQAVLNVKYRGLLRAALKEVGVERD